MATQPTVNVLALGSAAEVFGWSAKDLPVTPEAPLSAVIKRLEQEYPRLAEARGRLRFAVNQRYATPETPLAAGDEVAIIPPVSGGAMPAARLVREPIDVGALTREVENAGVGAIATFAGVVRYEIGTNGQPLRGLEYGAYDPMALSMMRELCESAAKKHKLHKALLVHRLGSLRIGDTSVAIVVSAPHREEAFDACREMIDGLKSEVPIFKKEIWQNGETSWVNGV
jgi:molybdopterin synthase catalytic subunit